MNDWGEAIGWPTRDPQWISKIVVMGLIGLIPILGGICLLGWMLAALDNLRAGRQELPPYGFQYLGRGINLFVVVLVYAIVLLVVLGVFFAVGFGLAAAGANANNGAAGALGTLVILLGYAVLLVGGLALYFLFPPIVVQTERGGIGAGLNVPEILNVARRGGSISLLAGLMTILAYIIGSIGSVLCGIGVILTTAYGYAMLAAVVRVYEQQTGMSPSGPASYQPPYPPAAPA